jgi:hypothetical protein
MVGHNRSGILRVVFFLTLFLVLACIAPLVLAESYEVGITATAEKTANPGDFVTHVYTISNTGTEDDEYQLEPSVPAGWDALGVPSSIDVAAGGEEGLFVTVVSPGTAQAGTYQATLIATSTGDPSVTVEATALITISSILGVVTTWIWEPTRAQPGGTVKGSFSITNSGNITDTYIMDISREWNCAVALAQDSAQVFPGEKKEIQLTILVPATLSPGTRYGFTIEIKSTQHPDVAAQIAHSSRVAPPPPEKVGGSTFPRWPVTLSLSFDDAGFSRAKFSGSGDLDGIGTFSAEMSATLTELSRPIGSFTTDQWGISLDGGSLSGGFGKVSGEGTGVTLFGKVDGGFTSQLLFTETVRGLSGRCSFNEGSLRLIAGSDEDTAYSFQEAQLSYEFSDAFSITSVIGSVTEQTSSGTAFRISPQVAVDQYQLRGSYLNISSGFPDRDQEQAYGMSFSYRRPYSRSAGLSNWALTFDTSKLYEEEFITWKTDVTGRLYLSLPAATTLRLEVWYKREESDDWPRSTYFDSLGLGMRLYGSPFDFGRYTISTIIEEATDRVANTHYLETGVYTSISSRLGEADIDGYLRLGRIADLNTGMLERKSFSFSVSLGLPNIEASPELSLSFKEDSSSLGIDFGWVLPAADVKATLRIPLLDEDSFTLSIETDFSIFLPFFGPTKGRVTGRAFIDKNNDGKFDPDEEPLPDYILSLDEQEAITNATGRFVFWPVEPGKYELSIHGLPFGLEATREHPLPLELSAGERHVPFPFRRYSVITGYIYNDANKNGKRDADESGISGAGVILRGPDGWRQVVAGPDGQFNTKVEPGTYALAIVKDSLPERFVPVSTTPADIKVGGRGRESVDLGAYQKPKEIIFTFGEPTARFSYSPQEPTTSDEVMFDASDSEAVGTEITTYEWIFQQQEKSFTATGEQVKVNFIESGRWDVLLTVTDANGLQDDKEDRITVTPPK